MRTIFLAVLLLCFQPVWSQTDFDHYIPLSSAGQVPEDFLKPTSQKVAEDYPKYPALSRTRRKRFVEGVNFGVDQLLHSGKVTFGNAVAKYLESIADKLLADLPALRKELRFYVLDENDANAFSTAQGVIFVTTGLIAQTTSEAQLAFVLAHEIIHYDEKHSLNRYEYVLENQSTYSYGEKMRFFSNYSRNNELEADTKGMDLYYKAGYAKPEIEKVFDVLLFADMPFEERPFPQTYFNSGLQYVDPELWPKNKPHIPDYSDYDDKLASHPNNTRRIADLEAKADSLKNWGTTVSNDSDLFGEVRNICRFQYLLNLLYGNESTDAIYTVFLLEHEFPDSHFLAECKAQAWLELMEPVRAESPVYTVFPLLREQVKTKFGELYLVDRALRNLPSIGKTAMGLRAITDTKNRFADDSLLISLWDKAIEVAASDRQFKLSFFSSQTFHEAADSLQRIRQNDSLQQQFNGYSDKYAVLKGEQRGLKSPYEVDTARFYMYSISDLKKDSVFNARYLKFETKRKETERKERDFFLLMDVVQNDSLEERMNNSFRFGPDQKLLLLRPTVADFTHFTRPRISESEETEATFLAALRTTAENENISFLEVGELKLQPTAADFNEQKDLLTAAEKSAEKGVEKDVFLLDVPRLQSISQKYGARYAVLFAFDHNFNPAFSPGNIAVSLLLPPLGLVYLPMAILAAHSITLKITAIDLEAGESKFVYTSLSQDPASYEIVKERLYSVLSEFNKKSNE